ncbi:MAG TPA: helix-hairpin-helix domain-containing protein [Desulfobulbus sp.]|nr:helix-hairpin-helix domain-containing protein [Desulfobulbus sp.]
MQFRHYFTIFTTILAVLFLVLAQPAIARSPADATAKKTTSKLDKSSKKPKTGKKVAGKVNINTADAKALTQVTGIGPKTAANIIAYRKKHGRFKSVDDLLNVKGIGDKTLKKIKSQIRL